MSEQLEATAPTSTSPETTPQAAEPRKPWGSDDEFNPDKAWNLLQNVRADLADARAAVENARKEAEAQIQAARAEAQEAQDAATESALSVERERQARLNRLTDRQAGYLSELTTPEAIAARAQELAADNAEREASKAPARPVDMTQGSTASSKDGMSNADAFAASIEPAFTR